MSFETFIVSPADKNTVRTRINFEDGRSAYIVTRVTSDDQIVVSVDGLRHVTGISTERW